MAHKSVKIGENKKRAEAVEAMMLRIEQAINGNVIRLGKDITRANEGIELIYEEMIARTLRGRFKALVKWVGGKE